MSTEEYPMSYRLTFAIPTYNGAHQIGQTLDSILNQITNDLVELVQIVVSDNGSTDETKEVIKKYQEISNISISYFRHEKNLGYDKNVDFLFRMADGDYVWTLADDDLLRPGAVNKILSALKKYLDPHVILVNFIAFDSDLIGVKDYVEIPIEMECHNPNDFLKNAESKYSLLSALIFSRRSWLSIDTTPGMNTNFIHVYSMLKMIRNGTSLIIPEPLVSYRQGSINFGTSGDSMLGIGLSSCQVVNSMKSMGYDKKIIKWLLRKSKTYIYGLVISSKIAGIKDRSKFAKLLFFIYPTPKVLIKLIPIILMPDNVFHYIYGLRKSTTYNLKKLKFLILSFWGRNE